MRYLPSTFFILLFSFQVVLSQQLNIEIIDKDRSEIRNVTEYEKEYQNAGEINQAINQLIDQLHNASFLTAGVDTLWGSSEEVNAKIFVGPPFSFIRIKGAGISDQLFEGNKYSRLMDSNLPISYQEFLELKDQLLIYAENNGYPFASIWLDSVEIVDRQISGVLQMDPGNQIRIDSIRLVGNLKIKEQYLYQYLEITPLLPYSQEKILEIRNRLLELPFASLEKDPTIKFIGDFASIDLSLNKKKSSRFDFLIGFLPRTDQAQRFGISGEFLAEFYNALSGGEHIFVNWKRIKPQTQELELAFTYPYLINLPFGVDLDFNLFRLDSVYTNVNYNIGLRYLIGGNNFLSAAWENQSSFLQNVDEIALAENRQLPNILDLRKNSLVLSYYNEKLDYRFNPRSGFELYAKAQIGQKEILKNRQISDFDDGTGFDYRSLYDTINLKQFQFSLNGRFVYHYPIQNRSTIKFALNGAFMSNGQEILENELFRIGGNKLMRGFDEQAIKTAFYGIGTLEYRYLLGLNAFISVFTDIGIIDSQIEYNKIDLPYGFGAGINFETNIGVFGFSYALGGKKEFPVDFRQSKIHFGYVNLF